MRVLLLSILLASGAMVAPADDSLALNGKWQIDTTVNGNGSHQECSFTQMDNALTGTCKSDRGTVEINGKVEAKSVTWTYKSEYNGSPLTVNYKGTVESTTKITGSVSVVEYGVEGEFTATQSK